MPIKDLTSVAINNLNVQFGLITQTGVVKQTQPLTLTDQPSGTKRWMLQRAMLAVGLTYRADAAFPYPVLPLVQTSGIVAGTYTFVNNYGVPLLIVVNSTVSPSTWTLTPFGATATVTGPPGGPAQGFIVAMNPGDSLQYVIAATGVATFDAVAVGPPYGVVDMAITFRINSMPVWQWSGELSVQNLPSINQVWFQRGFGNVSFGRLFLAQDFFTEAAFAPGDALDVYIVLSAPKTAIQGEGTFSTSGLVVNLGGFAGGTLVYYQEPS